MPADVGEWPQSWIKNAPIGFILMITGADKIQTYILQEMYSYSHVDLQTEFRTSQIFKNFRKNAKNKLLNFWMKYKVITSLS